MRGVANEVKGILFLVKYIFLKTNLVAEYLILRRYGVKLFFRIPFSLE